MKKIIVFLCLILLLSACSNDNKNDNEVDNKEDVVNEIKFEKTLGSVIWLVPPTMIIERIETLETQAPIGYPNVEKTGHPQEWDYMAGKGPFYVENAEYIGAPKYTSNAISVHGKGLNAIYDYDGYLLNASASTFYVSHGGFYYDWLKQGYEEVLSSDFIGTIYRNNLDGLCGGNLGLFEYKNTLQTDIIDYKDISLSIINVGCTMFMPGEEVNLEKLVKYRAATKEDLFGHRALVKVYDSKYISSYGNDLALYDENMNKQYVIKNEDGVYFESFVNGYIIFRGSGKKSNGETGILYAFYDVNANKYLTGFEYESVLPFVEGYAAVKKDGKWGYIDETGKAVTDFIFDSASTMYDGKVYVGIQDRFGILKLKETLNKGIEVNLETCYESNDENEAYQNALSLDVYTPTQKERDPQVVAEEEKYENEHKIIGIITPKVDNIRIRKGPSTNDEKVGKLVKNDSGYYTNQFVYEIKENEGYTWYRIGTNRWVADDGTWYDVDMFN